MKVSKANITNVMDLASERVCSVDGPQVTSVIIQTSAADSEPGMWATAQIQMVQLVMFAFTPTDLLC